MLALRARHYENRLHVSLSVWRPPTSMILTYTSSRATIARWYWRSLRRNHRHGIAWLGLLAWAYFLGSVVVDRGWRGGLLGAVIMLTVLALYPQIMFKPQLRTLEILPHEIRTSIGSKNKILAWNEVASIEQEDGFLVITGCTGNAFVIPPTAFTAGIDADTVLAQAKAWHSAAIAERAV